MRTKKRAGTNSKCNGENNGRAKLTNNEADAIRKEYVPYSRKTGIRALARKYSLSITTIFFIIHNVSYKVSQDAISKIDEREYKEG